MEHIIRSDYLNKLKGEYVRVDMIEIDEWEYGTFKDFDDDYVIVECAKHIRDEYMCEEKIIPRRLITSITKFNPKKKNEHEKQFYKQMKEILEEERKTERGVEIG